MRIRTLFTAERSDEEGPSYILPWWIALDPQRQPREYSSLLVNLPSEDQSLSIRDALSGGEVSCEVLCQVLLRHRQRNSLRRQKLLSAATTLLFGLDAVLSEIPSTSELLQSIVNNPGFIETEALQVWHRFIADCTLPASFQVPGRALSLGELQILETGSEGGRHRHSFADQQPWAARRLLRGPCAHEAFAPIDENPANAIAVSAQLLCCANDGTACEKAMRFARSIARHRQDLLIDRLLGGDDQTDRQIRSLLLEAHQEDPELLSHITNVHDTRRQIRKTIEMIYSYRDEMGGSFACGYRLAVLMIRMMVRSRFDPRIIDPHTVASGLVTMSADCLAAFASERLSDPSISSPEPDADSLDIGLLGFLAFVGHPRRPQLTARQLVRMAERAYQRMGIHKISAMEKHRDASWGAPSGWPPNQGVSDPSGLATISALTSVTELLHEGRSMQNCLANGRYSRAGVLGHLSFFSIVAGDDRDRATLALQPLQRLGSGGEVSVHK